MNDENDGRVGKENEVDVEKKTFRKRRGREKSIALWKKSSPFKYTNKYSATTSEHFVSCLEIVTNIINHKGNLETP